MHLICRLPKHHSWNRSCFDRGGRERKHRQWPTVVPDCSHTSLGRLASHRCHCSSVPSKRTSCPCRKGRSQYGQTGPVLGFWRISAQSNTEAQCKIVCCPATCQTTSYNSWLASTSNTSGAGALLTGTPRHLTRTRLSTFLKHPPPPPRPRYMTQYWKI